MGVGVAEVDNVERVDLSVVVHVVIDGITALEPVGGRAAGTIEVVDHADGHSLGVHHHISLVVDGDGSRLARGEEGVVDIVTQLFAGPVVAVLHIGQVFVGVLVDALVAQSVDGAEGVALLNTVQILAALAGVPLAVDAFEGAFVHIDNLVEVLRDVEVGAQ